MAEENVDTPSTSTPKAKGLPTVAKIAIGCVVVVILLGIILSLFAGWFMKKAGTAMLEKTIESQTGSKMNIEDLESGKMSFTNEETGETVNIGSGEIPATFPKDFPIYPGSTVTSTASGSDDNSKTGFWVTLATPDDYAKVVQYYKSNLSSAGWTANGTYETGTNLTQTLSKNDYEGTITISRESSDSETSILVILGTARATETPAQ